MIEEISSKTVSPWQDVVEQIDCGDRSQSESMENLFMQYACPLYSFLRERGENAEEVKQSLKNFYDRLVGDHEFLRDLKKERDSLRTFLLYAIKIHQADDSKLDQREDRFSQDTISSLESWYSKWRPESKTPEAIYDFCWALTFVERSITRMTSEIEDPNGDDLLREYLEWPPPDFDNEDTIAEAEAIRSRWRECLRQELESTLLRPDEASNRRELKQFLSFVQSCGEAEPLAVGVRPASLIRWGFNENDSNSGNSDSEPELDIFWEPPEVEQLAPLFPDLEILELIGRGGMSGIYRARQKGLDRMVALKLSRPDVQKSPVLSERFTLEAKAVAMLNHPNIVTVYDFGLRGEHSFFLLEMLEGGDLNRVLEEGDISFEKAAAITCQVCDALQYAHDNGVVHRDIKPGNILLDEEGRAKLVDFGLVKFLDQSESFSLTQTGTMVGTPSYLAPEQIEDASEVDHRTDIYSVGVVFYKLLTGELPMGRFDPPSELRSIDKRIDDIVFKALEKRPERRYQRIAEMGDDIRDILG
ncbi:MAG: tRNA A-37 threonylcarbamoyl transferase component Bud32 [Verrucomicrobiales bacterium]|jgi:tRNA A-37 threonylcarbamoyl transferase component Bud32